MNSPHKWAVPSISKVLEKMLHEAYNTVAQRRRKNPCVSHYLNYLNGQYLFLLRPREVVVPHPWRCPRPGRMGPWAA